MCRKNVTGARSSRSSRRGGSSKPPLWLPLTVSSRYLLKTHHPDSSRLISSFWGLLVHLHVSLEWYPTVQEAATFSNAATQLLLGTALVGCHLIHTFCSISNRNHLHMHNKQATASSSAQGIDVGIPGVLLCLSPSGLAGHHLRDA